MREQYEIRLYADQVSDNPYKVIKSYKSLSEVFDQVRLDKLFDTHWGFCEVYAIPENPDNRSELCLEATRFNSGIDTSIIFKYISGDLS